MPDMGLVEIPTATIHVGPRLRPVDPATVANLQVSIEESRWFGAILVRPLPGGGEGESRYGLVAGAHRLAAMRGLGRPMIAATVRVLTDDEALQIEIDENLVRRGLTALERAEMVAARFAVWSRRFKDRLATDIGGAETPKRGRPKNSVKLTEFLSGAPETMGFAADTAAEVGLSTATVERAFRTINGLPADLRDRLRGTPVAKNDSLLRQLAGMGDKALQAKAAEFLVTGEARTVAEGMAFAAGNTPSRLRPVTPTDETLKAFQKLWKAASPMGRHAILHELAGVKLPAGFIVREDRT
jgi:ParB family chromosome partitioning protein